MVRITVSEGQQRKFEGDRRLLQSRTILRLMNPDQTDRMEEVFELLEGDVIMEVVDEVPSITFLNRVHKFIERNMSKTLIVKLLGLRIRDLNSGPLSK
ncbi:hypothetical protein Goshw_021998 [Gossypium schwendimanii]|uniref:Uncharacterized protein n=1 Tax=Gossypium schwendimanii TaxID=34291 RepID=A0A7J9MY70_GOSSC|nr:hypothetical protein [Gossypium schwendimanii]